MRVDFADPKYHHEACEFLLSCFKKPIHLSESDEEVFVRDINQYYWIVCAPNLCHDLNHMIEDLNRGEQEWMEENRQLLLESLTFTQTILFSTNVLLIKYLFRFRRKKSKLLSQFIISTILYEYEHELLRKYDRKYIDANLSLLVLSMPFWKKDHFLFVLNCNLCKALMIWSNYSITNAQGYLDMKRNLIVIIFAYLWKFKLVDYFLGKLYDECLQNNNGNEKMQNLKIGFYCSAASLLRMKDIEPLGVPDLDSALAHFGYGKKCAWIKCKKTVSEKLYKCKGCKLMLYCCRNHQKKHWNCVHSLSCRFARQRGFEMNS